jgi:hypothetical protein
MLAVVHFSCFRNGKYLASPHIRELRVNESPMDREETYDPTEIPLNISMLKLFRHPYYD